MPDVQLVTKAELCGERILRFQLDSPFTFGFPTGTAGNAHALGRLARIMQRDDLAEMTAAMASRPENFAAAEEDLTWLTGAVGLGHFLLSSTDLNASKAHTAIINQLLEKVAVKTFLGSQQLCRGLTGQVALLADAARVLDRPELRQAAVTLAMQARREAQTMGGYDLHPALPRNTFLPGFFEGLSGIGYEWLRLAMPGTLPSVLTWE